MKSTRIKEYNEQIISERPEMTLTKDSENIKFLNEFCILPYANPIFINETKIAFDYGEVIFKKEFWDSYEIILQNTGKQAIMSAFLQIQYEVHANIYSKKELFEWQHQTLKNYYQDICKISTPIYPNEKIKIIIYFPQGDFEIDNNGALDLFMLDSNKNYWHQANVNYVKKIQSEAISPEAFDMHLKQNCFYWYQYDYLFYAYDMKKYFHNKIDNLLEKRKKSCYDKERKQEHFLFKVNNGEIKLH